MPQNGLCCGFLYECEHHNLASSARGPITGPNEERNLPFERSAWLSSAITWTSSRAAAVQYSRVHEAFFGRVRCRSPSALHCGRAPMCSPIEKACECSNTRSVSFVACACPCKKEALFNVFLILTPHIQRGGSHLFIMTFDYRHYKTITDLRQGPYFSFRDDGVVGSLQQRHLPHG